MTNAPEPARWRAMRPGDLRTVTAISDAVHGRFSESEATYAERLALHPAGCIVLEAGDTITGYLISHPWRGGQPPALNARLGTIPPDSETYCLHDIALLPAARGTGAGKAALAFAIAQARLYGVRNVTLMAVNGADSFWASQGFAYVGTDAEGSYGADCHVMQLPLKSADLGSSEAAKQPED